MAIGDIFLVDAEHLGEPFVSEVDVSGVHLVQDEVVAVVAFLSQLSLELVEVDRPVVRLQFLLLLGRSLSLRIFDASLARLALLTDDNVRRTPILAGKVRS